MKMTEEHKNKIRIAHRGKKHSEETRKKISKSMMKNQNAVKKVISSE